LIYTTYFKRHPGWSNYWKKKFNGWFGDPYRMKDPGWVLLMDSEDFQPENHDDKWDGIDDKFSHDQNQFSDFFKGFDTDPGFYHDFPDEIEIGLEDEDHETYKDGRIGAGLWRQFRGWCGMRGIRGHEADYRL
jgi:hypothetical protein